MTAAAVPAERRRSPAAAAGWAIAFLIGWLLLTSLLGIGGAVLIAGSLAEGSVWLKSALGPSLLLQGAASLVAAGFVTWAVGVVANRLDARDLRYAPPRIAVRGAARGLLLGAAAAGAALVLAVAVGGAAWTPDAGGAGAYVGQVGRTLLVLAPAALAEEVVFRGVALVLLARAIGRGPAVGILAVLFGLAHLQNPNTTAIGIANIVAAGVFLSLVFYTAGGIWAAFGAHLGWNGALAALDAPVSGLPFDIPMIDYSAGAPAWLTGGAFGPEGGAAATVAIAVACAATVAWLRKERA